MRSWPTSKPLKGFVHVAKGGWSTRAQLRQWIESAFDGYTLALWQDVIWVRASCISAIKSTFDGLEYGLLTAGTFGWLCPLSNHLTCTGKQRS